MRLQSRADPNLAAAALEGLARYEQASRTGRTARRPVVATEGPASLRDCGGTGRPVLLVPSLINPPDILDLDEEVSLASAVAAMERRALLLDWGPARPRDGLDLAGHVEELLIPLLRGVGEPCALIGYCLGGTMAIAAANLTPVERVATLAAPWRFSAYPSDGLDALARLWEASKGSAAQFGVLPMEVLQSAFWSLDPRRTVAKFARFADLAEGSGEARRFVVLEDWANEGEPLPVPAARELIEDLFGQDVTGEGRWRVGGRIVTDRLDRPVLNVTAANDRITPAASSPGETSVQVDSGHVGMVVGSARTKLHAALGQFLAEG